MDQTSLVKFVPGCNDPTDADSPDRFQFLLTDADYLLFMRLAEGESGTGIHQLYDYCSVITCDEHGTEVDHTVSTHVLCSVWVSDFQRIVETVDLRPSDLYAHLGETKLIPIVHDLRESLVEYKERQYKVTTI